MKTPEQNIKKVLAGKKVLFLENDNGLSDYGGQTEFEDILKKNGIEYTLMLGLSDNYTMEEIVKAIHSHDCIVFMTQWVYEIAQKLRDFMFSLQEKKIVIEVYINEPSWYYKPKDAVHDVYIYTCQVIWDEADKETESFYKLTDKPYWDYKNKFDK